MDEKKLPAGEAAGRGICACGTKNSEGSNFCRSCGRKLKEVCDCWVKKGPYRCGRDQCPGYRLFLGEFRNSSDA